MYCRFNYTNQCNHCVNYVKSTSVELENRLLTIEIEPLPLCNHKVVCICLAQPIPDDISVDSYIQIKIGGEYYSVVTPCSNYIYSDQILSKKIYCFKIGTDTKQFTYCGGWRLCKTKHIFNCIPMTMAYRTVEKPKKPISKTDDKLSE